MEKIDLVPIKDLLDKKFFIPSYQRGYRWTRQQVIDLLEDVKEFIGNGAIGIYCIQPLVVKGRPKNDAMKNIQELFSLGKEPTLSDIQKELHFEKWDVIDGQQRLTTIKILLSYLQKDTNAAIYNLEYETRHGSNEFLNAIATKDKMEASDNIDFFHMKEAYDTIKGWFEGYVNDNGESIEPVFAGDKAQFLRILKEKVQFIWHETEEPDPIKVFTRQNIGKIALTDAELIKALFLNQSNFKTENKDTIRLQQIEIANEWDRIEYTLQNDEFWLFIQNNINYRNATRIDFIFEIIRKEDPFKLQDRLQENYEDKIGNDTHQTFRYFYEYFKAEKKNINAEWLRKTWLSIKLYFQIFEEWYNDLELYHYVGYLIHNGYSIQPLIDLYIKANHKGDFSRKLKHKIINTLSRCKDLNRVYGENGEKKRDCFPLLLLYNIQSVIDQNNELVRSEKYSMGTFYKFPFHLFKKESKKKNGKGWEVEHIASNSGDDLESLQNQKMWLSAVLYSLQEGKLKDEIETFLDNPDPKNFDSIRQDVERLDINPLKGDDKQKVWNYALLDSSTNEEYQNDPFPIKRICVIAKEHGYKAQVLFNAQSNRIEINKSERSTAFVPPCTKNVFTKAYTDVPTSLSAWSKNDAEAYLKDIEKTLMEFLNPDL